MYGGRLTDAFGLIEVKTTEKPSLGLWLLSAWLAYKGGR